MKTTTDTTRDSAVQDRARGAHLVLPPGNVPSTIVIVGGGTDPKLPIFVGDSWRPAVAGLLGAVPLAVAAAMTGAALMGTAAASTHASGPAAQECVGTAGSAALGQPKYPACLGD